MLTGNGVAFVLRVPGTQHGDWWSLNGWTIFAGTAAVSLLSKYVIKFRGSHIFNPSNFGLVLCFLLLGPEHAEPLDFWWGPMTGWLALALAIIVVGGLAILIRLRLIVIAVAFWVTFAAALAVLMGLGHAFSARWHLGPVTGHYFWWVLVTSPEVLVFLFFMITDPKTTPKSTRGRVALRRLDRPARRAPDRAGARRSSGRRSRCSARSRSSAPRGRCSRSSRGSISTGASSSRSAPPRSSPTRARSPGPGSGHGPRPPWRRSNTRGGFPR